MLDSYFKLTVKIEMQNKNYSILKKGMFYFCSIFTQIILSNTTFSIKNHKNFLLFNLNWKIKEINSNFDIITIYLHKNRVQLCFLRLIYIESSLKTHSMYALLTCFEHNIGRLHCKNTMAHHTHDIIKLLF